ncbi:MAG: hypothetical protein K2X77_10925 [Candidatus Obscuribacterales bacterium]|nr:hypothetical protein [Candidatus Obscuribacterales bacterium]
MPKFRRSPQVVTRLAPQDMERFRELALTKAISYSSLLRDAALYYLDHYNQQKVNEFEGIYAQQLRQLIYEFEEKQAKHTNRICALLAKNGIDGNAVKEFLARIDESGELMRECTSIAAKRLKTALAPDEQKVASSMSSNITNAS